jgi:hypothetical protein
MDSGKQTSKNSSLQIDFGKNDYSLSVLDGKFTQLGTNGMAFQQTFFTDSLINGKKETLRKIVNTYFENY